MVGTAQVIDFDPARRSARSQPYPFVEDFQKVLATVLCHRPGVFGRIGTHLDTDCFSNSTAKLAISAAKSIETETGAGPSSLLQVIQFMRRRMDTGQCTLDEIDAVDAMFSDVQDRIGLLEDEAIYFEVVPVLKRRMQLDVASRFARSFSSHEDLKPICEDLQKSLRVGEYNASPGVTTSNGFDVILEQAKRKRVEIGIRCIDDMLDGGMFVGTQMLFVGRTGSGKSTALIHVAASLAMQGKHVAYATLELSVADVLCKLTANMTGVPSLLIPTEDARAKVEHRMGILTERGMKPVHVQAFEPLSTTPKDLFRWVDGIEKSNGIQIDALIVDYLDKLAAPKTLENRFANDYKRAELVTEPLRLWAEHSSRLVFTASQATRMQKKTTTTKTKTRHVEEEELRKLELDDTCDSMHKVRVPDYVITINGKKTLSWHIAKNRWGRADVTAGPSVPMFELSRVDGRADTW